MGTYDVLYLALFAGLPVGMAFLGTERRFLLLWALILLLPREFNVRWGPLSFCLADSAFLGFLLPEILAFQKEGWRESRLSKGSGLAWAALGLLVVGALFHAAVSRPDLRIYLKDLLPYLGFIGILLALRRSGLSWGPIHAWTGIACLALMAAATLLVAYFPPIREAYFEKTFELKGIAQEMGYFLPAKVESVPISQAALGEPLSRRIHGIVGGIFMGVLFLFFLPILLGSRWRSAAGTAGVLGLATFIFYGILFVQSRTILGAVFLCLSAGLVFFRGRTRILAATVLALFTATTLSAPVGQKNLGRFNLLKKAEMEARFVAPSGPEATPFQGAHRRVLPKARPIPVYDTRFPIWRKAAGAILEKPLMGMGPGSVLEFPYGAKESRNHFVDNLYLTLALKWGIGGALFLFAWLWVLGGRWKRAWPSFRDHPGLEGAVLQGAGPTLLSFLFLGIFLYPLMNISFGMFLGAYLGLTLNTLDVVHPERV